MKKYLSFILAIAILLTCSLPVSALEGDDTNLINLLFNHDVIPLMYRGVFEAFISEESENADYVYLRDEADKEMLLEMLGAYLRSDGITTGMLEGYVDSFFDYFTGREEEFNSFIFFVSHEDALFMPLSNQESSLSLFPGISNYINENFYGSIYFFNLFSRLNDCYFEARSQSVTYLIGDEIHIRSDALDYFNAFRDGNAAAAHYALESIRDAVSYINTVSSAERSSFADYLVYSGIMSMNMEDASYETDDYIDEQYGIYYQQYSSGTAHIKSFANVGTVFSDYASRLNSEASYTRRSVITSEAMTAAATVTIYENNGYSDGVVSTTLLADELLFAAVNAQKLRNEFISNAISVAATQAFDIVIEYDRSQLAKGFRLTLPSEVFENLASYNANNIIVKCGENELVISLRGMIESAYLASARVSFRMQYDTASKVSASLAPYAQGNEMLSVGLTASGEASGYISSEQFYYRKNVSYSKEDYDSNYFYSVAADGTRSAVNNYNYDGAYCSFEIGDARYFVRITGALSSVSGNQTNQGTATGGETDPDTGEPITNTDPSVEYPEIKFTDLPAGHWAYEYVKELVGKGILSGMGDGTFCPDDNLTREQFTKMLVEAFGMYDETAVCEFTDVPAGSWYEGYVASAYSRGIVGGIGDGAFGSGQSITRQDLSVMLERAAGVIGAELTQALDYQFNDIGQVAEYAKEAIMKLAYINVISGFEDNTLRGGAFATRAQAAKMLSVFLAYAGQQQ